MPRNELFPNNAVDFLFAKPVADRTEPLFWVKEIRLLRKFSADINDEIRRIEFKKRLNISCAEAPAQSSPDDTQRISGHATGKTTLCRMIRYMLGEKHIAAKNVANAIQQQFPEGYVVGQFFVQGESWCVARSFMKLQNDFSLKMDSLDEFLSGEGLKKEPYKNFEERLTQQLTSITPLTLLANQEELTFRHLLPWLTRDQDSQYTKLTEWRDNSLSDSGTPGLAQKQAMLVMRSILDPQVAEEAELVQKQAKLAKDLQDYRAELNKIKAILDCDAQRIGQIDDTHAPATDLEEIYLSETIKRNQELLVSNTLDFEDEAKLNELRKNRDDLLNQYYAQADSYNQSLRTCKQHQQELRELEKNSENCEFTDEELDEIQIAAQAHPTRKYCCAPLDVAFKERCQLAWRYTDFKDQASHNNLNQGANALLEQKRIIIQAFQSFLKRERQELAVLKKQFDNAEKVLTDFELKVNQQRNSRAARIGSVLEAIHRYQQDLQEQNNLNEMLDEALVEHKKCTEDLAALRESERRSAYDVMKIYNDTIRFVLGREIVGKISFSGGDIELDCSYDNSSLSSAALNAVKNICFDLTALASAIGGVGGHPRFLIHDGPRVSDLAATIFKQYFLYAYELEKIVAENSSFQYIITTTEPPPVELQKLPWLVCKLDATSPETRLLKCNL